MCLLKKWQWQLTSTASRLYYELQLNGGGFQGYVGRLDASQVCCIFREDQQGRLSKTLFEYQLQISVSLWLVSWQGGGRVCEAALNWNRDEWNSLKLHLWWSHTVIKKNPLNQKWEGFLYFCPARLLLLLLLSAVWHRHQLCHPSQQQRDGIISVLVWPISQSWRSWQPALDWGLLACGEMALFDNVLAGCCRARLEVFFCSHLDQRSVYFDFCMSH